MIEAVKIRLDKPVCACRSPVIQVEFSHEVLMVYCLRCRKGARSSVIATPFRIEWPDPDEITDSS
jgi:hypothetical protein